MFCNHCGQINKDGALFCAYCGKPISQPEPVSAPTGMGFAPGERPQNSLVSAVKRIAGSPLFLVAAIVYTHFILAMELSVLSWGGSAPGYLDLTSLGSIFQSIYEAFSPAVILSALPEILVAVGFWIFFASARSRKNTISTAGLTLITVVLIVDSVGALYAFVEVMPALFQLPPNADAFIRSYYYYIITGIVIFCIFRTLGVFALFGLRRTIRTGTAHTGAIMVLAIALLAEAGVNLLRLLISPMLAETLYDVLGELAFFLHVGSNFISMIQMAFSIAVSVLFGVFLLLCKKSLSARKDR